jgi:hypothetical protein
MAGIPTAYTLLNYVWSDIFDKRVDYAGYHSDCDERVVRGTLSETNSCIFYLKRQIVVAYCAFNARQRRPSRIQSPHQVGHKRFTRAVVRPGDCADAVD